MKEIFYAGSVFVTGNEIALGLIACSEALAESQMAESIEIPLMEHDGSRGTAVFLIGPASQLVAKDVLSDFDELIDDDVVQQLRVRTRALRGAPVPEPEHVDPGGLSL